MKHDDGKEWVKPYRVSDEPRQNRHRRTLYWAERAMVPEMHYEPVATDGTVYGHTCCLPEAAGKVDAKRRQDHIEMSAAPSADLPIWC